MNYKKASETKYKEYIDYLIEFNLDIHTFVKRILSDTFGVMEKYDLNQAICATGSDGRYEKGPGSKLEFILLTNQPGITSMVKHVMKELNGFNGNLEIEDTIEQKHLKRDIMSCYNNESSRTYPTRITDAAFLYGDESMLRMAKAKMVKEFQGEKGKSILKRVNARRKEYEKILINGKQKHKNMEISHFDLEEGISTFSTEEYKLSFKIGPLRYIQTSIMQDLIKYARAEKYKKSLSLFTTLPTNTEDKLLFFEEEKILSLTRAQAAELADNYNYFLWEYNKAQENMNFYNEKQTPFDKIEVKDRLASIREILKNPVLRAG